MVMHVSLDLPNHSNFKLSIELFGIKFYSYSRTWMAIMMNSSPFILRWLFQIEHNHRKCRSSKIDFTTANTAIWCFWLIILSLIKTINRLAEFSFFFWYKIFQVMEP